MTVRRRYALLGTVRLLGALLRALRRSLPRKGLLSSTAALAYIQVLCCSAFSQWQQGRYHVSACTWHTVQ